MVAEIMGMVMNIESTISTDINTDINITIISRDVITIITITMLLWFMNVRAENITDRTCLNW
ncbi:hypothetical protein EA58_20965 [Photobacterium galatheae]|uniref:Uncharacterized protein n=1 Tax=Photobacterium galatheae TaxID=1654360 RepID=A0A066RH02_9GAMM|nr:hypothetical protein EA58_20965 [Photobacterium galatheae]